MLSHLIVGRAALGADRIDLDKAARLNCRVGAWWAALAGAAPRGGTPALGATVARTQDVAATRGAHLDGRVNGASASATVVDLPAGRRGDARHRQSVGADRRNADVVRLRSD